MAGTVTITEQTVGTVKKIHFAWVSDASGNVTGTGGLTTNYFSGELLRLVTVPNGGGTDPTSYTATLLDSDGTDALMGGGATRSATVTEQVLGTSLGAIANSQLTLNISGAGNAKGGDLYVYIR
jgi:hypothetical protein